MGTPDFAVGVLEELIKAGHVIPLVITQPDRIKGRGRTVAMSAVKECALSHGIEVFQPLKVREAEAVDRIRSVQPDLIVVAAFGQILTKEILDLPVHGCMNVHASLLPKYRGAAPIQQAIMDGEKETGISIMHMDEGLDTGPVYMQRSVAIEADETGGSLFDKLSHVGAELCVEAVEALDKGTLQERPQDDSLSTYASTLKKEMGRMDFSRSAQELERLVRALNPWPSAFAALHGKTLKIWKAAVDSGTGTVSGEESISPAGGLSNGKDREVAPGTVIRVGKNDFSVKCGEGSLTVLELQLEGKKRMSAHDFLLGAVLKEGDSLS